MIWRGRRVDTGEPVEITIAEGLIRSIEPTADEDGLPWLSPGWIDLQVNGFEGHDLNGESTTTHDVIGLTEALYRRGVASYLPTVITGTAERIRQAMSAIAEACDRYNYVKQSVAGIHLEGPYVSGEDGPRGAHEKQQVRDPDWDEFAAWQEASGGRIRLVTVAPEREGAIPFIRRLAENGITVSIGHTCADPERIAEAVQAGATLSTHLGNGAHPHLPRHPNYIWDQLAEDRLWATFIADGHHLAPPVLKAMLRAKRSRFIFVSDSVKFGGMPPGRYASIIGAEVELHPNGKLTTAANPLILAGSAQSLEAGLENAVRYAGISLSEAVEAVTLRPAHAMGWQQLGRLVPGAAGNLTLFRYADGNGGLTVTETVVAGTTRFTLPN